MGLSEKLIMHLSPIILFVYNRLWYTQQTIRALQKNIFARESELFIYSDGAKSEVDREKVCEVREYIKTIDGFKNISIIEREKNYGLAENIISGVTEIVNRYGTVIVLEDDIVTSPYFLKYMNEALGLYENEEKVMHISGWTYPAFKQKSGDTFFWHQMNCWGWGTWKRAWIKLERDVDVLIDGLTKEKIEQFTYGGRIGSYQRLLDNRSGKVKTWAVFWNASIFLNGGLCLNPIYPLSLHIGHGEDATHVKCSHNVFEHEINDLTDFVFSTEISENRNITKKIENYLDTLHAY